MSKFGFLKIGLASHFGALANFEKNVAVMSSMAKKASRKGAALVVFPQLSLTGCSCFDLFSNFGFVNGTQKALFRFANELKNFNVCCVVGVCININCRLFNCAAVVFKGKICGLVVKNEVRSRWFSQTRELSSGEVELNGQTIPIGANLIFKLDDAILGVQFSLRVEETRSLYLKNGVNLVCCLFDGKFDWFTWKRRKELAKALSVNLNSGVVAVSSGLFESSADSVYLGSSLVAQCGKLVSFRQQKSFSNLLNFCDIDLQLKLNEAEFVLSNSSSCIESKVVDLNFRCGRFLINRKINKTPYLEHGYLKLRAQCEAVFRAQVLALARRVLQIKAKKLVVGVSGGLDSTLALLVAAEVCKVLHNDEKFVLSVTMPGFGTGNVTKANAIELIKLLQTDFCEIDISNACRQHFADIGHDEADQNVVFENAQARERTQILMDLANEVGGLVVGTSDLTELALGFCTFAGDHMAHFGVNSGLFKTAIKKIVEIKAICAKTKLKQLLFSVLETPISPELIRNDVGKKQFIQCSEQILGPYILHDFFLFYFIKFGFSFSKVKFLALRAFEGFFSRSEVERTLKIFVRRFFTQQFKRSSQPEGPSFFGVSLSPRTGFKIASDASAECFLKEL